MAGLNQETSFRQNPNATTMIIACGALAQEIIALIKLGSLPHCAIHCLPAIFHNTPEKIIPSLTKKIAEFRGQYEKIFIAYGDCGTGGLLDKFIAAEGLERLPGAHCYAFYAGLEEFDALMEEEIGSFFLTDYLVKFFEQLIIKDFKIDKRPEIKEMMFAHYKKLVYLAQTDDAKLTVRAREHAEFLGLDFQRIYTGYGLLENIPKI